MKEQEKPNIKRTDKYVHIYVNILEMVKDTYYIKKVETDDKNEKN